MIRELDNLCEGDPDTSRLVRRVVTKIVKLSEYYQEVREFEKLTDYELGFADCSHIVICKNQDMILVTRDRILLRYAKIYIDAELPENLTV